MTFSSRSRAGLMFLCAIIGLGGLLSSHANAQVKLVKDGPYKGCVESITGLKIEETVYDVKFIFGKSFNEVYGEGNTVRTPAFWGNAAAAKSASNAIKECLAAKKIAGPATHAAAVKESVQGIIELEYLLPVMAFREGGFGPQYVETTSVSFDYGYLPYDDATKQYVDQDVTDNEWKTWERNAQPGERDPGRAWAVFTKK